MMEIEWLFKGKKRKETLSIELVFTELLDRASVWGEKKEGQQSYRGEIASSPLRGTQVAR
jgi:hypothetical protein